MADRDTNMKLYREIRDSFSDDADRFVADFADALAGIDRTDMVAVGALIMEVGSDLYDELREEWRDEAYQDDIDSGWAAERHASMGY